MLGDKFSLFDSRPNVSVQTLSYATMARISFDDFSQMLCDNLDIRESLINSYTKDPFDEERDFIVGIFKEMIPYLRKMDDSFLK